MTQPVAIAALRERFPNIREPQAADICYATQNRQDAVGQLNRKSRFAHRSGQHQLQHSNRLAELANRLKA